MLACVVVFFNPHKYRRILKNFFTFCENFPKSIPLYVVEASFDGSFETDAKYKIRANPSNQYMWQKERMINWVVDKLPDRYDRYMYSDCDLIFPDRFEKLVLESDGVVQCFEYINFLDTDKNIISTNQSSIKWVLDKTGTYGSPGGAWAYPRDVVQYDRAPVGAGDSLLERAMLGLMDKSPKNILSNKEYDYYLKWSIGKQRSDLYYLPITIGHLYHGSRENRKYIDRHIVLQNEDYDPEWDVQIAKNGLLSWASYKPKMHQAVKSYFAERKEDD